MSQTTIDRIAPEFVATAYDGPTAHLFFCQACAETRPLAGSEERNTETLGAYLTCAACIADGAIDEDEAHL